MGRRKCSPAGSGDDELPIRSNGQEERKEKEPNLDDEAQCQSDHQSGRAPCTAAPDVRERWEQLPVLAAVNVLIGINLLFFSMFYVELVAYFQIPTATLGWPNSIRNWMSMFSGMLVSGPVQHYGCRKVAMVGGVVMAIGISSSYFASDVIALCFSYGLAGGFGEGMVYFSTVVTLQQSFHNNRVLANGVSQCGLTVGYTLASFWAKYLLEAYGWRGGLLLHAGLMLQTTVLGTRYNDSKRLNSNNTGTKKKCTSMFGNLVDFSLLKDLAFVLFSIGVFFHKFCQSAIWLVLPMYVVSSGGTLSQAALVVSIMGVSLFIGRLSTGVIANLAFINTTAMFGSLTVVACAAVMLMVASNQFEWIVAMTVVHGLGFGGANMLAYAVLPQLFGVKRIARSSALSFAVHGVAAILAPPFAGWLFDATGTYNVTFLLCGSMGVVGGFIYLLMMLTDRLRRKKREKNKGSRDDKGITKDTTLEGDCSEITNSFLHLEA